MFYQLDDHDIWFPDPALAEEDGLLAVGGDLSTERLRLAYAHGIFPWYNDDTPILWYSPQKRFVLFPEEIHISKSMRKVIRNQTYTVTKNLAFNQVIQHCAQTNRFGQDGTWITTDMQEAYIRLHREGLASSIEVWHDEQLCGGLYGVICGKHGQVFCGESMFSLLPNTSKLALIFLCETQGYQLIDCQIESDHLKSMGARLIDRKSYLRLLQQA